MKSLPLVMGLHACPISGCKKGVASKHYLCSEHQKLVPERLLRAIEFEKTAAPWSNAHYRAMQAAIDYVNKL